MGVWFELVQPFSTCSRTMEQDSLSFFSFQIKWPSCQGSTHGRQHSDHSPLCSFSTGSVLAAAAGPWPCNKPGSIPWLVQLLAWMVASATFVLRLLRGSLAMVQAGKVQPCCYCLRAQPTARQNHLGYTSMGLMAFPRAGQHVWLCSCGGGTSQSHSAVNLMAW